MTQSKRYKSKIENYIYSLILILYTNTYMTKKSFLTHQMTNISIHMFILGFSSALLKASMKRKAACSEQDRPAVPLDTSQVRVKLYTPPSCYFSLPRNAGHSSSPAASNPHLALSILLYD